MGVDDQLLKALPNIYIPNYKKEKLVLLRNRALTNLKGDIFWMHNRPENSSMHQTRAQSTFQSNRVYVNGFHIPAIVSITNHRC